MTQTYDVINPATERVIEAVTQAGVAETNAAVARATAAYQRWRRFAPAERARLLRAFAAAVDADLENLARLETANAGHTITSSRGEAAMVRDVLYYYAAAPE